MSFTLLPTEILLQIFDHLSPLQQYNSIFTVCKRFYHLSVSATGGLRRFEPPPKRLQWPSLPLCAFEGWAMDPQKSERNVLAICTDVEIKDLLQYLHLPSMREVNIEVNYDYMNRKIYEFDHWLSSKPSNITVLNLFYRRIHRDGPEILLSVLPFLEHLDLDIRWHQSPNVIGILAKYQKDTLKTLRVKSSIGSFNQAQSLAGFLRLEFVELDYRMVFPYRTVQKFEDIFPSSINHIRLDGPAIKGTAYSPWVYMDKVRFLQGVRNLDFRQHLPLGTLNSKTYVWKRECCSALLSTRAHDKPMDPHHCLS